MAALTAMRHNPDLQRVFLRLKAVGKSHKVAIVDIMRKLIVLANFLPARRPPLGRDPTGGPRMTHAQPVDNLRDFCE